MSDEDRQSNASMIREIWEFFPTYVNLLVIFAIFAGAIIFGGQQFGFWLDNRNIAHQKSTQNARNSLVQNSSNTQQGYVEAITTDVSTIDSYIIEADGAPNRAMMIAAAVGYGNQACLEASYLTGSYAISKEMQDWINNNCSGGALSITSPIRSGKEN